MPEVSVAAVAEAERLRGAYRWMLLARRLEEKISSLYHSGKIVGGVYLGRGQEAFSAALGVSLWRGRDIFAPLIRDMAGRLAFGEPLLDPARTYLGSVLGPMRGRDGNIHRGRPAEGMPAMISHLEFIIFGALIVFFLIAEPHGLARLWAIGKEKLRLWPFPH